MKKDEELILSNAENLQKPIFKEDVYLFCVYCGKDISNQNYYTVDKEGEIACEKCNDKLNEEYIKNNRIGIPMNINKK